MKKYFIFPVYEPENRLYCIPVASSRYRIIAWIKKFLVRWKYGKGKYVIVAIDLPEDVVKH